MIGGIGTVERWQIRLFVDIVFVSGLIFSLTRAVVRDFQNNNNNNKTML